MSRSTVRELGLNAAVATLLLWLPFVVFLKHNSYGLACPEVLLLAGLMALAGLIWGAVATVGRTVGRVAVFAFLAVLVVDVQTGWITTFGLRLLLNAVVFGILAWLLRRRLAPAVILLAGVMTLGTVVAPGRPPHARTGPPPTETVARSDLPCVIHLVLDEHIGVEGIPREFDPSGAAAADLRDGYLDLGFTVFGRAYSRYYYTATSLANALNFVADSTRHGWFPPRFERGDLLRENAWFALLRQRGYRVHVVQTDYMSFHAAGADLADGALTVPSETVGALADLEAPAADKARFILGSYQRLSFFLQGFRRGYGALRRSAAGRAVGLPAWDESGDRVGTLSALAALDLFEAELEHAGPGRAFLAHLLLPHYPYALRADGSVRSLDEPWLNADVEALRPRRNDTASRAERYPQYLEQLEATRERIRGLLLRLSARDWWHDAIVVVHGDHGSRLDRGPARVPEVAAMPAQDFLDAFSILFAVKSPVLEPGYDRRPLPLEHLLGRILRDGADPGDEDLEAAPQVWIVDGDREMIPRPLPFFAHGRADSTRTWSGSSK